MTPSEETILFQSHDHIAGKLETLIAKLDKLNAQVEVLPELLQKILDLYLVADSEQPAPAPAVPAEPSEEDKDRDAIVAARVADLREQVYGFDLEHVLTWTQLIHVIAYQELNCCTLTYGSHPVVAGYSHEFVSSAALRAQAIVEKIKTVTSEELHKYLESQNK